MTRLSICLVALVACTPKRSAEKETPLPPVVVSSSVDKAAATTGDVITYTVTLDHKKEIPLSPPDFGSGIAGFRIEDIQVREKPAEPGRERKEHSYKLRADLIGSYVLPPVEVSWKQGDKSEVAKTPAIFVEVKTVLKEGEGAVLNDLKPLVPLPRRFPWWLVPTGVGALAAGLTVIWLVRRRGARPAPVVPPPPAEEVALARLYKLQAFADHQDAAAVRAHYFELSEALREYVEGRYRLPATDRTTPELVRELRGSAIPPQVREVLLDLLGRADVVKFADAHPSADESIETLGRAFRLVEDTSPRASTSAASRPVEIIEEVA